MREETGAGGSLDEDTPGRAVSTADGHVPPTSFRDLAERLQADLASLPPGYGRVAQQLLTDPEGSAFMTVSELAGAARVDQSTVTRFAGRLGLAGYPALSKLCQDHLREQAQTVSRLERLQNLAGLYLDAEQGEDLRSFDLLDLTAASDRSNIVRSFARIDASDWAKAVQSCASAVNVYVIGMRKCYAVAYLLRYLLGLIRENVHLVGSEASLLPDSLGDVGPADVCIGISIHRYTRLTLQGVAFARQRGARTIAFTDNPASLLVPYADTSFFVDTGSVSVLRSVTAFVSMAQALVAGVAVHRGTRARSALLVEEDVLKAFDVYASDADFPEGGYSLRRQG